MAKRIIWKSCLYFLIVNSLLFKASWGWANGLPEVYSPDKKIRICVINSDKVHYKVYYQDKILIDLSEIKLYVKNHFYKNLRISNSKKRTNSSIIVSPIPEKRKEIPDIYNALIIRFKEPFSLEFRAYNDGIAYRWFTHFKDSIYIQDETSQYVFPDDPTLIYSEVAKREHADIFHTSFEEPYQEKKLGEIKNNSLIFSPLLISSDNKPQLVLTESDLEDYAGMFLTSTNSTTLEGRFAAYPLEEKMTEGEFPQSIVTKRADYLAYTKGTRGFPWRVMLIAPEDKDLPINDLVYRLASPSRIGDASWIQPGKGTDEWIIGINLFNVPFKAGINTATYKYYIDFAKKFGFDRIMLDAGWSDYKDLFKINPEINMDEIAGYAREKGIQLSLWTLASTFERQLIPALEQFKKWGVSFVMTDFMDRDDQKMLQFYFKTAEATAKAKIMIMYHGAFKPAGFSRTFPHAVTREGVLGSEYNIWSEKATPKHNVLIPFIRMTSGPMDYEPGILDNAQAKTFRPIGEKVMAQGTRCHQLAMFAVYDSPIQIFSGNPSQGLLEPEFMYLLGSIPTVWDNTLIPDAQLGEYIISARKTGKDWFIAGMNNENRRNLTLRLDFLEEGNYEATLCEDGINADRYASDYKITSKRLTKNDLVPIQMAIGGGFLIRLRKVE